MWRTIIRSSFFVACLAVGCTSNIAKAEEVFSYVDCMVQKLSVIDPAQPSGEMELGVRAIMGACALFADWSPLPLPVAPPILDPGPKPRIAPGPPSFPRPPTPEG